MMATKKPMFRSFTRGDIKTAWSIIQQNRARSVMTIVGIVVAVVAVILIIGVGDGVKQAVKGQVNRLGKDLIMVRPGSSKSGLSGSLGSLTQPQTVAGLDDRDLQAVASASGVKDAVPLSTVDGVVAINGHNAKFDGQVIATTSGFASSLRQEIKYGGFLDDSEGADGRAVIGSNVATTLFGESVPLGQSFDFRGHTFVVSGIFKQFDSNPLLGDADFNNAIFINYDMAQKINAGHTAIYEIVARASDSTTVDQTAQHIEQRLRVVHGGAQDFSVLRQGQSLDATNNILDLLTRFIVGAAGITLLIGGIGIMNIMLVSVTERMHEIGIRKAVGATNRQILQQFLLESVVLSSIGAVIGLVVAVGLILLMNVYSTDGFHPVIPWVEAVITVVVAVLVGAVFGTFPALKAARKDPIDALRNE